LGEIAVGVGVTMGDEEVVLASIDTELVDGADKVVVTTVPVKVAPP